MIGNVRKGDKAAVRLEKNVIASLKQKITNNCDTDLENGMSAML